VLQGGATADTLTGDANANVMFGYGEADTISGGAGNDTIDVGADAVVDTVVFSVVAANGQDTITNFVIAKDVLNVEKLAGGDVAGETAIAAAAVTTDLTTAFVGVFANGANGTDGVSITNYTDLTVATLGSVVAFLAAGLTEAAAETYAAVINDLTTNKAYVYNITVDTVTTVAGTIEVGDVTLVGVVTADAALTIANTTFTA
jgi:hypothetical protein